MSEEKQRAWKRRKVRQAVYGSLVLIAVLCGAWYLTSDHFREFIRHRIIAQLEDATGGQVEVGRVEWNLSHLRVAIEGLTIHGLEPRDEAPLLQVRRVDADVRIVSIFGRQVSFNSVEITNPAINLLIYPNGTTNQPTLRGRKRVGQGSPLDPVFDFAIRSLTIRNGVLKVNERRSAFEVRAGDVSATVRYEPTPEAYAGVLNVGKVDTQYSDLRPFSVAGKFDFRLFRNALEIRSGRVTCERSDVAFDGKLTDFAQPRAEFNYNLNLDVRQAGAIARDLALQAGVLKVTGRGAFDSNQMVASGKVQLSDGAWNQAAMHVAGVSGTALFHADRDRLTLTQIAATGLGGAVSGDFTVEHWQAAPREVKVQEKPRGRGERAMEAPVPSASGEFKLRDLQLARVGDMFSSPQLPLAALHAVGSASGTAELAWMGTPRAAELKLRVEATPPSSPSAGGLPVTAQFEGTFRVRQGAMEISQADVQTPNSHVNATGSIGGRDIDLALGVTTVNIHELQPLLANFSGELPVQLAGEGSFQGKLEGATALPDISGHLRLTDFTTVIQPSSPAAPAPELIKALHKKRANAAPVAAPHATQVQGKPVRFHWDGFDGYVAYGPDGASVRNGVLRTGSARFEIAGTTTLQNGSFTDRSVFHGTARIHDARVEDVQALLGLQYPISGNLNLELQMDGTRMDPHGSGKLSIADGTAYDEPLQSFSSDIQFSGREARFTSMHAVSGVAKADGSGSVNVSTGQFRFDVHGSGVDLLRFPVLQTSKVKLTGSADFRMVASGTAEMPTIEAHVRVGNITLGSKHEGDLNIDATTHGENLDLSATSDFVTAKLSATGKVHLRGDLNSEITANFANVDLQPFLLGVARGHSSIDGTLHVTGPLKQPLKMQARLEIPHYESQVEGVTLRNPAPIVASYKDGIATLESLRLTGEATDLSSTGTLQLTGEQQVRMRLDGQLNLTLLQSFNPEIVSYGHTAIAIRVDGTVKDPRLRGRINIEHAGISYVDLPNGLSDLNGTMVFNEDRLQVEKLTAHTGGGDLAINGFIAYRREISFNLSATGKDIRIRYPEGVSANGDANLRLAGTLHNSTLSGDVVINKFGLNPRFDFATYFATSKQLPVTPNPDSPLNNLHFDVRVVSTPELQVQTTLARITGNVDLRMRGTAMRPVVLGRISIVEGNITFNGTKYRLDRGDILFSNPAKIEPVLDLEASARVSDYDISIGLHGTTDKLNTTYRSDPPLPTADVFALLAFGHTTQPYSNTVSSQFTETASSAVLGSALNAAVSSRVQKLFGASRIKIDPEVGGAENNPNARITVEQQVSGNITLTYITNLAQSAQQVIQFEYNVNRNVSIVGVRDEYGIVGFEVQIRQRKR